MVKLFGTDGIRGRANCGRSRRTGDEGAMAVGLSFRKEAIAIGW